MEPVDPNQAALSTAAERLGELLEEAATSHELDDQVRRELWRKIADAAGRIAAYAALLAGEEGN